MQENHPWTAVVGPLVGLALLVIAIAAAVNYLQQGVAEQQAQMASAPSASQPPSDGASSVVTPTAESTTVPATAVSAAITETETVTDSVASVATPAANQTPTPDTEAATAGASADVLAVIGKAGCAACHTIPGVAGAVGQLGPNLANIGVDGATRKPDLTAAAYISESIIAPNAFIVPECPTGPCLANLMPQTFSQTLTGQEITTIVDYLTTLKSSQ